MMRRQPTRWGKALTLPGIRSRRQAGRASLRSDAGFSITEMLVSTVIMMAVTGATFALMNPAQGIFQAQPEVSDMQQRLRVGVDTIYKDVMMAGAGTYSGAAVGTLGNYFATIVPARLGAVNADPPGTVKNDTLTIMYVPPTSAQTTITDPMPNQSAEIKVNAQPGCPVGDPLCGFKTGMTVMLFDETGAYDTFTITNVQAAALHLQHRGQALSKPYGPGSYISQIGTHTYYLKTDTVTETYQLMHYDGLQSDIPIADNVVGLTFEYYGDPAPPVLRKPVADPKGPWTTYGPKPPALGVNNAADNWGAGENCVFLVDGASNMHAPRLPNLNPGGGVGLVQLTSGMLTDGPWCPDSVSPNKWDADLLRIRKVRVRLRVQAGLKALRGSGALFTRAGTGRGGDRFIPDQEIRFDITPRNMNLGR